MALVKMGRQTVSRIIVRSVGTATVRFAQRKPVGLQGEHSQGRWGFAARGQARGLAEGNLPRG